MSYYIMLGVMRSLSSLNFSILINNNLKYFYFLFFLFRVFDHDNGKSYIQCHNESEKIKYNTTYNVYTCRHETQFYITIVSFKNSSTL